MNAQRKTISTNVSISGIGLHSGIYTTVELRPAPARSGITFVRADLHGLRIPALQASTTALDYATTVGKDDVSVGTVEHLLSAIMACGVSDIDIHIDGPEVPIIDGSALPFMHLIDAAGVRDLGTEVRLLRLREPIEVVEDGKSIRMLGATGTMIVAVVVALLCAAAAVFIAILAFRTMGFEDSVAINAATLLILAPSMTLFSPLPDVAYPLLTLIAIACWWKAVESSNLIAAAAAALVIFAASLISYPLIAIGIPLFLMTVVRPPRNVLAPVAVAAAIFFGAYAVLFLTTHYPAYAAFRSALDAQRWLLSRLRRPYPGSIPFDLIDFCLGLGFVTPALAIMGIAKSKRRTLLIGGLLTPVAIAAMGLMQAENARVWIFLMPLIALPAAIELSTWPLGARLVACASLVMVTIALHSTMEFIFV